MLAIASWLALDQIQGRLRLSTQASLDAVLETSHRAITNWLAIAEGNAALWASRPEVRSAAQTLLDGPRTPEALARHPAQRELRRTMSTVMTTMGGEEFFLVAPEGTVLASSRNETLGASGLPLGQSELHERIFSGESAASLPRMAGAPAAAPDDKSTPDQLTMFVGAPVLADDGSVMAAFVLRLDPNRGFLSVLTQGRFGESGETYAVDGDGLLISDTRHDVQLVKMGLVKPGERAAFHLFIRPPDSEVQSGRPPAGATQQPLTVAARGAVSRSAGASLTPYPDYRGVRVVGAWRWIDRIGLGLITEVEAEEAFAAYRGARSVVLMLTASIALMLAITTAIFISNRRRVQESESRFRGIVENLPGIACQLERSPDGQYRYTYLSTRVHEYVDVPADVHINDLSMKGRGVHPDDRAARHAALEESAANLTPVDFEYRTNRTEEGQSWLRMLLRPQRKDNGTILWEGVFIDVTAQKRAELALSRSKDELELRIAARTRELWSANRVLEREISERKQAEDQAVSAKEHALSASRSKSEFLANMSHELRTPLNAINGFAELIETKIHGSESMTKYTEYARNIRESGEHLLQIINDILDLAKLEARRLDIEESRFLADKAIKDSVRLLAGRANEAGITIEADDSAENVQISGDSRRFKQVLINLLANAIKFSDAGDRIQVSSAFDTEGNWTITVADSGVGIAEEDLPHVLTPFGQGSNQLVRTSQGTGLGLPLAKEIMELHDGRLELESVLGEGTTVRATLPAQRIRILDASDGGNVRVAE